MLKKQILIQKGVNLLTENPIILLYQFNHVSTKNWQLIRNEIKKIDTIDTLVIQNKIGNQVLNQLQFYKKNETVLKKKALIKKKTTLSSNIATSIHINEKFTDRNEKHPLQNLFQGPTFILGCKTKDQLSLVFNILKRFSNFVFIGGLYNNQRISHLSLEKLVKLNDLVKEELIQFLETKKLSLLFLNDHLVSSCSNFVQTLKVPLEKEE